MKKKRVSFFWIGLAALFTMVSCGEMPVSGGASGAARRAKGSLPLAGGGAELSIFMGGINDRVTSFAYEDNMLTKKIVDETGVKLNIIAVPEADANQRFNAMMSSGDYPDIILHGLSRNDLSYFAGQGILVPLDGYDYLGYPNIKGVFERYSAITDKLRGADGKLYALPDVNECLHCIHSNGRGYYYMPFIRDNGQKPPQTLDEFTAYLRYVRDNDVNKNGNPRDEIPVAFAADDTKTAVAFFAKAFMPFVHHDYGDTYFGLGINKGKVWEQYRDNEFREALAYMNMLYKEGLIAENSFTMTADQLLSLGENPDPIVAVGLTTWAQRIVQVEGTRFVEYFHLSPLEGPTGQRWGSNRDPTYILTARMMVTNKCKDPELALAWYDYMLNFDVMLTGYVGPKGLAWDDPDPNALGLGGGPAAFKLLLRFGAQPVNASWNQANPMNRTIDFRLSEQATGVTEAIRWLETGDPALYTAVRSNPSYNEIQWIYGTAQYSVPYAIPAEYFLPPLVMGEADADRIADISAVLNSHKIKAFVEFITGVRNINNNGDWNAYLAELDRLNSREMADIFQKYIK
jgi:putative aldouronate transport system substrate-binding protein